MYILLELTTYLTLKQNIREGLKEITFMESGASPWPVVETTKMTASS